MVTRLCVLRTAQSHVQEKNEFSKVIEKPQTNFLLLLNIESFVAI
jgi:hypothetical protein